MSWTTLNMWVPLKLFVTIWLLAQRACDALGYEDNKISSCSLSDDLIKEIEDYAPIVHSIIDMIVNGTYEKSTWQELSTFVDKFGPRPSGSQALEDSIQYMLNRSVEVDLENVHGENVTVPHWVRGSESATLLEPRKKDIALLGLGYSVGTDADGITADVIVVRSFAELKAKSQEVPGKIVVYNQKFVSYGETVKYRSKGATEAAKHGAVAALIRSVTPLSLYTPHTGMMSYGENVTKIPAACITVEDATLLNRMANRGERIRLNLKMEAQNYPDKISRNVIAEIVGAEKPHKTVVVSGHIDSWDVGQGAMDDGGGAFISWNSLAILKSLNLRPKRTIRAILWTAEEMGIIGARQYIQQHRAEQSNLQFVMESDMGTFEPLGLDVTASAEVMCILKKVMSLLTPLGDMKLRSPAEGPDIEGWTNAGVPGASLWNKNRKYFWYHHTNADTMLVENPDALDMNTALFAAVSYVLADLSYDFPQIK